MESKLSSEEMISRLARYLLQIKQGERLKSVRQLAKANATSVGTVSNALTSIENTGAVKIDRRGHLGSFVDHRSIGELWALAEREPMVICFPLIAHPRLEGLATALKKALSEVNMDVYLTFIRGSRTRMKALGENKCHIAVMSQFAANELAGESESVILKFPAETYVTRHEVFYRPGIDTLDREIRVAIDKDSFDVEGLTKIEFQQQAVQYVSTTYMQLPRLLKSGIVDAGIWSIDDMLPHLGSEIHHRPLSTHAAEQEDQGNTCAVLVARTSSNSVRCVVEAVLHPESILEIQQKVIDGEMVPEY